MTPATIAPRAKVAPPGVAPEARLRGSARRLDAGAIACPDATAVPRGRRRVAAIRSSRPGCVDRGPVEDVHEQVGDDDDQREQHRQPHHDRVVPRATAVT